MIHKKRKNITKEDTTFGLKDDKVRVTRFSVSPVNPKAGKPTTIKMVVQNVSSHNLKSVPWQIVKDKKVLNSGCRYDLPPGDSFTVSVSWTAASGSHFIYGDVDPENTLHEPKIKQFNNLPQGIDVKVK
jgi:hypothetical protein